MPTSVTSPDVEAQASSPVRNPRPRKPRRTNSDRKSSKDMGPKHGDASATYWKLYRSEAENNDQKFVDGLKGNTDSMVILNTLFSSIVASFIIEIYKTLQTAGGPSSSAFRINIVLFLSFFLSIVSAVSCALLQQWCNEYMMFAYPRAAPYDAGRVRTYLFRGLRRFQMRRFMSATYVLLHISVFLFFWALSDFFYTVDHLFGIVTRYTLVASAVVYILFSISPLIFSSCPYNTPMTPLLRVSHIILRIIIRFPKWFPEWCHNNLEKPFNLTGLEYYEGIHFNREKLYSMKAKGRAKTLEPYAMKWLFTEDDFSDDVMDKFLEGLPGYISSGHTEERQLDEYLAAEHVLSRIKEHFVACATSVELSNKASIDRVFICLKALRHMFKYSRDCKADSPEHKEVLVLQKEYTQELMGTFELFHGVDDPVIALRASCIVALAAQGMLSDVGPPVIDMAKIPFPMSYIPITSFLFGELEDNTDGRTLTPEDKNRNMWNSLLHDGPVANLTKLGQSVLDSESKPPNVPPLTLSFCWEVLDILLTQIKVINSREPPRCPHVQSNFDILHDATREFHSGVRGFRVKPLLDKLDTVARGLRFLMVFSSHPEYHNRVDVEFGKEDLRNGDLLEAFAHCLPDFISNKTPDVRGKFMEKVIRDDDLWASLQMNLRNTQTSDSPTHDKLRVFEICYTVLDVALSVLEDSRKVDWRAREFESLLQHFEPFITHCFRGAYIGTARFRVGIIKARFCKALLAQIWNNGDDKGIGSFQSLLDVASIARLFHEGYIGDFIVKVPGMVENLACDGPLLIFCQLGYLVATTVSLDQPGIEVKDIVKVWELQEKVIENTHLPLDRVSDPVWEALIQLREQVDGLQDKNKGKDQEILQRLLRMIDVVVAKHSTSPSAESTRIRSNQFSFASESTAVSEGDDDFESASSSLISRTSIELQPERPTDKVLDREKTYVRSESPQSFNLGFHSLSSLHPTFPGFSATSPGLVSRASTDAALFTRRSDAHTVISNEGQSGADPTSDEE